MLLKDHIRPLLASFCSARLIDLICERFWVPMGPRCELLTLIAENRCLDFQLRRAQNCALLAQYYS